MQSVSWQESRGEDEEFTDEMSGAPLARNDLLKSRADEIPVNTIHPEPEIHEQIYMTKGLRNTVHDYKHILTFIERIVNNCVNDATHADELTMQH